MEVYENFMKTAKVIWEEFTGTTQPSKPISKEDKSTNSIAQI